MKKIGLTSLILLAIISTSISQESLKFVLVKNINKDESRFNAESSYPSNFTVFNNKLIFAANGDSIGRELYISDGTTEGTKLLKNINTQHTIVNSESDNASSPNQLTAFRQGLIFSANDGIHGEEPWFTDGTTEGTFFLKDIVIQNFGSNYGSNPTSFTTDGDKVFFLADTRSGDQLFITDGTPSGTSMVKNVAGAAASGGNAIIFRNKLYYNYSDYIHNNDEPWYSDGTGSGTHILKDITPGSSNPSGFFEYHDLLYFSADSGHIGRELWVTDGTEENTRLFKDINQKKDKGSAPSRFTVLNDKLYFVAADSIHGFEMWCTDGDTVYMVKDISPDTGAIEFTKFHLYNNRLYFKARKTDNSNHTLWISDGTEEGTHELLANDSTPVVEPEAFVNWHDKMIFKARTQSKLSYHLWMTDGTVQNTKQIFPDSITGWNPITGSELVLFKDEIYFSAQYNDSIGSELYKLTSSVINDVVFRPAIPENILVYPNPFSENLVVETSGNSGSKLIQIMDINGKVVFKTRTDSQKLNLSLLNLSRGIYLLNIQTSNETYIRKLIKN